ncbi:F0F1 ATP synthase subunit A [Holospora undulata]|uniref:ATP synthase subunit a n=1 Tax=Holospora undulata HU1 TaxID=1321371 RepID=A0A061JIG2_9PROT|nr:F0F1 ATP synthase subunit A [Holospora undulata]ETZ05447.1 ATP synthase subunit a [Holospora undulata HU1]
MDPLAQFQVKTLFPLKFLGIDISITNSSAYMILITFLVLLFFKWGLRHLSLVPSRWQSAAELPVYLLEKMVQEVNGVQGVPFVPMICSAFFFVFLGNVLGLFPYAFTITGQLIVNLTLALILFVFATAVGLYRQGVGYMRIFFPKDVPWVIAPVLVPIEVISYISRPVSLSVRLFVNMLAGHSMMKIIGTFVIMMGPLGIVPMVLNVIFTGFELFIAFLQAYVFSILSCIYLNDALQGH